ncbi:Uncharacterised protein [Mycobacteroides abscessus subsp. abscessus]|nr:Uncharacterised protein [Mycobacteroides abscessus subsp. abscessus]
MKHTQHVHVDQLLEGGRIDLQYRTESQQTGVRDYHVDSAEPLDSLRGNFLHGRQVAHIGDRHQYTITAQLVRYRGKFGLVQVGEHHVGALGIQPVRHLDTDSAGTAGDHDRLARNTVRR